MTNGNKTLNIQYRFLSQDDFYELHQTNLLAFSDYVVPMQMTQDQFENHIVQNSVILDLSVGAFSDDKLIGFTLNGFGIWNGMETAYDAGTGVVPEFRRKGIGKALFDFLLPKLKGLKTKQILLEVLSNNGKAINLYKTIGFVETRKLLFFKQAKLVESDVQNDIQIRQIEKLDWDKVEGFWDCNTSWQFSIEAVRNNLSQKFFFGAFLNDKCVGYGVLYPTTGVVAQIAVDKNYRRKKVATMLLEEMQRHTNDNKKLRFSNIDKDIKSFIKFAGNLNFSPTISQIEMILEL